MPILGVGYGDAIRTQDIICQEMIEEADVDGDGNVNYEEFVGMIYNIVSHQMPNIFS